MARGRRGSGARGNRSRSKSTSSKGKSSSSKGKSSSSKGKSSSSKGKSSSGSKNKRGSGARNNRSTTKSTSTKSTKSTSTKSTKSTSNKGGSGGRNNPSSNKNTNAGRQAAKTTAPKKAPAPKKTPAPKAKTPTKQAPKKQPAPKKKEVTKAQQMAKDRIAAGKTVSQVKTANKESMKVAAKDRDTKFKQTGVQTFGGKKTTFTKAEEKKITDAGYKVAGYSKAPAKSNTQLQVDKDTAQYGNTVPSGSFGISEEGKALAAQQRAEAAAKKKREKAAAEAKAKADKEFNRLRIDNPEMAKYIQTLDEGARIDALIGGQTRAAGVELGIGAGTLIAGKAAIGSLATGAATKGLGYKGVQAGFTGMGKRGFDAIRGGAKYIPSSKPQILGKGAYSAPTLKGAQRYAGATGSLGGAQTPGGVIKSIVPGKASRIGFIESQAKVPGATFDKGVQLANRLNAGNYASSPLANRLRSQMVSGVAPGGGFGANLGNVATKVAGTTAGGLNIASGGGVGSGETSTSNTARSLEARTKRPGFDTLAGAVDFGIGAITGKERTDLDRMGKGLFGKDLVTPRDVVKDAGMVAGKIRNNELSIGDVKSGYRDIKNIVTSKDRLKTIGDMNTKDLTRLATKGYDVARDSAVVQTAGERLGLPSDFKQQTDTLRDAVKDRLSSVKIGDRDSTYKAISDFNRDIGTDPKLSLAARQAEAFRSGEGTTMQKIAAGFQPGAAKVQGLSAAERGVIGSVGNRIISGKQTDIAREAMSGMKAGSSLTAGNLTGIAQNVIKNTAPGADTVSAKRASQIKSIVSGGRGRTDITPSSLLKGVNPFRGSNRGGGGTPVSSFTPSGGGGGTPVGQVPQIPATGEVPQFQVPELPVQQGTDASTLSDIQNESYQNTFRNLMAINPNYSARFRMRRRGGRRGSFKRSFSRRFFR